MHKGSKKVTNIPLSQQLSKIDSTIEEISEELTERQKLFCKEWIWDYNGTRSYKTIYKVESDDTAAVNASKLLSNTKIQAFIKYLKDNLAETSGISPLMVLNEHRKMAFSSIAHLHLTWITRKEFEDLTDEQKACIQEIDTKIQHKIQWEYNDKTEKKEPVPYEVEYIKIKLYDKQKSLESINKMLGYNEPEKLDLSNKDGSFINLANLTPEQLLERLEIVKAIEQSKKSE